MTGEQLSIAPGALDVARTARAGSAWLRLLLSLLATVVAGALLAGGILVAIQVAHTGRVLPGIRVGGVDLSGLDRAAAAARLAAELAPLDRGAVTLELGGQRVALAYADVGRGYDLEPMLDAAFAVGRSGDLRDRALDEIYGLARGSDLGVLVRWDQAALDAEVARAAARLDRAPTDAAVLIDAGDRFTLVPSTVGRRVDRATAVAAIGELLADPATPPETTVPATAEPLAPALSTQVARVARLRGEEMAAQDLTLTAGTDSWSVPAAELRRWIRFVPDAGQIRIEVGGPAAEATLSGLADEVKRDPKDATFLLGDSGVVGVLAGADGRLLDVPGTLRNVGAGLRALSDRPALADRPGPPTIPMALTAVRPELSTEEAEKVAPIMKRISTWTTYYEVSERNFYGNNITIPARIIDGTVVRPGEWFSFWETVGVPTREQGYGAGGAIINGKTSPTGAFAGGICSTSTTLFNAAARAGLEIGERINHYYYITRYPLGLDATVWMYSASSYQDVSFRNDTPYPILIRGIASPGVVRFDFYSVDTGRKVGFSTPIVKNVRKAWDTTVYTTAIPPGTTKRIEYPDNGMDVWVTRTVWDKDGKVIHQETYFSRYARITGILWVGKKAEPQPSPTPEPSPTPSG